MKSVTGRPRKGKKTKVLGEPVVVSPEEFVAMAIDAKVELIQALIPIGLMAISETLEGEVTRLAGQRVSLRAPRVRNLAEAKEVSLQSLQALRGAKGSVDDTLLRRVLYGLSCRDYEAAAEAFPGAIGLSPSTVSRQFIQASAAKLRELQERDLSAFDIVAIILDGKTFADDTMVTAVGVTLEGQKVILGFVQAGTENAEVLARFLRELVDRGLNIDPGVLVVLDGSKGLRAAVRRAFGKKAVVQRCQWHKRENVVEHLPKGEQAWWRKRLQRAYERPTYAEAKAALKAIRSDLAERNLSAVKSLDEGFEETLTLHRLGVFPLVGISLKTTNCLESIFSRVEARTGRVCHWKNSSQKQRWLATALLDLEPRLRRIRGYKHLPRLRQAIQRELGLLGDAAHEAGEKEVA